MIHVICRLTAKNQDQLRNSTLGRPNRVWATLPFYTHTGWAKKAGSQTHDHNSVKSYPINFFTGRFLVKFAVKWILNIAPPPHLDCLVHSFVISQCVGQARKVRETTTLLLVTLPNVHRFKKNSLTHSAINLS